MGKKSAWRHLARHYREEMRYLIRERERDRERDLNGCTPYYEQLAAQAIESERQWKFWSERVREDEQEEEFQEVESEL